MSRRILALALVACAGLAGRAGSAEEPPGPAAAADPDRAAIAAVVAEFVRAFDAGDARAVAALFTEGARIEAEGEPPVEGRAAIEAMFAERFESEPGRKITIRAESLRLLGPDAAVETGTAVVEEPAEASGGTTAPERSRYTAAYVRKDGRWLQDSVLDFPAAPVAAETTPRERLAELEWLVGDWIDQDDEAEVHTTCEWAEGGAFLIRKYRVEVAGSPVMTGVQRIGWDPRRRQLRSWTFDSEGGLAEGLWSREDGRDRWVVKATGILKDGRSATATNVLSREGRDVFRWSSEDRTLGASALPGVESVTLVRRPPAPGSTASLPTPGAPARSKP